MTVTGTLGGPEQVSNDKPVKRMLLSWFAAQSRCRISVDWLKTVARHDTKPIPHAASRAPQTLSTRFEPGLGSIAEVEPPGRVDPGLQLPLGGTRLCI